jgi:type I restriction enzyme M protein
MSQSASISSLIWAVADLLRGDYKPADYGKVILPFTILRRLDCVLASTKAAVLAEKAKREAMGVNPDPFLLRVTKLRFVNTSPLDLKKLMGGQDNLATNHMSYIQGFTDSVRDVFERFRFAEQVDRLRKAGLLYQVTERFAGFDLLAGYTPPAGVASGLSPSVGQDVGTPRRARRLVTSNMRSTAIIPSNRR